MVGFPEVLAHALGAAQRRRSRHRGCVLLLLVLLLALGATRAGATGSQASTPSEFTLDRTSGLVGSFGGFGGQFNQHVYAKISGPPPYLLQLEEQVIALQPQFVRIFFNTTEWQNTDRLDSFVRTVRLADRSGAEINITWQGSTFDFAIRNMDRFAEELVGLLTDGAIDHLWVTMFNEPNTTQRTLLEYQQVYRRLDRELRERSIRSRIRFMGGDLVRSTTGPSQAEWFQYMASEMGDMLDAWSVHVYWDFWDAGKIDERLLKEVRTIYSTIPEAKRRPLYVTEFGVRGVETFEGEPSFQPGFWPDGTGMSETNTSAFQHAWFNIRAAQLGYTATVKWDVYPAKYDLGSQDFATLGPGASRWQPRPVYNLLQLLTLTTKPRGGDIVDVASGPGADASKLLTAYVSPAKDITILGIDTAGGAPSTTSADAVRYRVSGLPPTSFFRLLVWNDNGSGANVDRGFVQTDAAGTIELSVPLDAVFALTNTPIMALPS